MKQKRFTRADAIDVEEFHPLKASPENDVIIPPPIQVPADSRYGKPLQHNPEFRGPIKDRSCTDVICCIIFVVFVLGLVVVGYFGFAYGNPRMLLYPMNSQKELCGLGKRKDENYLLFFDLVACGKMGSGVFATGCPTPQICVSECPTENWSFLSAEDDQRKLKYCKSGADRTKPVNKLIQDEDCPAYLIVSKPILNRCVPEILTDVLDKFGTLDENLAQVNFTVTDRWKNHLYKHDMKEAFTAYGLFLKAKEYGEKVIQDVIVSWWMIVVAYILAIFVSLIWIILMRWIAGILIWTTIILFVAVFTFSSYWCISSYLQVKGTKEIFYLYMLFVNLSFSKEKFFLGFGIASIIILAIVLLILLCLVKRIRIAVSLIKEGSRAVGHMLMTLIFPVFIYTLQVAVIAYWLVTSVYLASIGREPTFNNVTTFANGSYDYSSIRKQTDKILSNLDCDVQSNNTLSQVCTVIKNAEAGQFTVYLQIYNLFMLFWLVNFVIALGEMTLAGAFASYYWAFNKPKDIPTFPLLNSLGRCFRYHLGTLAFGSLLVAIIQIIRVFLEYIDHKLKASENHVAKFLLKCLKCCFWCLEKLIRFLNKNAYIMVAIHGKNFCASAKSAFMLIMRNVVRVFVVDKVTDFLLFIGKLLVVGGIASSSYFFFNGDISFLQNYKPSLNFYMVPICLVTIGSYIVAACFFNVYSMAVDTLFLCFLEDLEQNDGSKDKPYFMPKNLLSILHKKNKTSETK